MVPLHRCQGRSFERRVPSSPPPRPECVEWADLAEMAAPAGNATLDPSRTFLTCRPRNSGEFYYEPSLTGGASCYCPGRPELSRPMYQRPSSSRSPQGRDVAPPSFPDAFPLLVESASNRSTITYGELADQTATSAYFVLPRALGHIWSWCQDNGYPHINALVVSKVTGIPGRGYRPNDHPLSWDDWVEIRDDVYNFDQWVDLIPPQHWPPTLCG